VAVRRTWIVSPGWDLFYLVLTPVLIVPIVLVAARQWLSAEQIYLAVISFASLGHHLPGFMRAYGDRELFERYRWRFLLAPPLALGLALVFTPPAAMRTALGLPWEHLHGLELILLLWGTWHGLMQTYGFMRIYDLRRGENDRTTARLDHALCLAMFVSGVAFSDTRMFSLAGAMWQAGLPVFGPEALSAVRWTIALASGAVAAMYSWHLLSRARRGQPVNGVKLLLAGTTGWFWWYCGRLSTNLLIGVAMFEIFHAVQYNAIVWIYNRRLLQRAGERFGPLGFMFRDRTTMLCLYLAGIAAYSSIRYFTAAPSDRMFSGDLANAHQWLVALFVASSLLHFYYDGFIWKVSERKTRDNLVDEQVESPGVEQYVPGLVHAGKWGVLLAVAAYLAMAERSYEGAGRQTRQAAERAALAALTPNVPEAQMLASQEALAAGRYADARPLLEQLVARSPQRWQDHCDLGECYEKLGDRTRSEAEFRRAVARAPRAAEPNYRLGLSLLMSGDAEQALVPLRRATELAPRDFRAHLQLGDAFLALGKPQAASDAYARAVELRPASSAARVCLADSLIKLGRLDDGVAVLREGLERTPDSAALCFTLGLVLRQSGHADEAAQLFDRAEKLGLKAPNAGSPHEPRQ
jgi:tetratricopeptide (TPR) repeat protein